MQPKKILIVTLSVLIFFILGAYLFLSTQKNFAIEKPNKIYHIGILNALSFLSDTTVGFKQKMSELGYQEGKNIFYDEVKASTPVGNQAVIKKFVDANVDLIVAFPTEASLDAKEGTKEKNIPVIAVDAFFENTTLVENAQHPEQNITGVRFPGVEASLRTFEILHLLTPKAKRMAIFYLKDYPSVAPQFAALDPVAKAAGVTLIKIPLTSPPEFINYFSHIPASGDLGFDAILVIAEPLVVISEDVEIMGKFADAHHIPIGGGIITNSDYGSMFSYAQNPFSSGMLAAPLADKIFHGIPISDLPVITPENELSINYKVIHKLGLTIDDGLLSQAKKIVH